ncbi:MAG: hypothetical protein RRY36_09625 [Bacteroidaceae bacterium]
MLTIEEGLQILPTFIFPDRLIQKAMGTYKIAHGTPFFEVNERDRDLATAIMWDAATGLTNGGASKKQIGNRSITTANLQVSQQDREAWANNAKRLRGKWGMEQAPDVMLIYDMTELW